MAESQQHGFLFQTQLEKRIRNEFMRNLDLKYTDEYDLPCSVVVFLDGESDFKLRVTGSSFEIMKKHPVDLKVIGLKSNGLVEFSDEIRIDLKSISALSGFIDKDSFSITYTELCDALGLSIVLENRLSIPLSLNGSKSILDYLMQSYNNEIDGYAEPEIFMNSGLISPCQIKAKGYTKPKRGVYNPKLEMGSLLRTFEKDIPWSLAVILYEQKGDYKCIKCSDLVHISRETMEILRGDLSLDVVREITDTLTVCNFPKGQDKKAREWAKEKKKVLKPLSPFIELHPKIDSKAQRRWQCSIHLNKLYELSGRGLILENRLGIEDIYSPRRKRNKKT